MDRDWARAPGGPIQGDVRVHRSTLFRRPRHDAPPPEVLPPRWTCPVCGGHSYDVHTWDGTVDFEDYEYEVSWCDNGCAVLFDGQWYTRQPAERGTGMTE